MAVALPIAAHKEQILSALRSHPCVLLEAEAGSGKSTQIPQYLLQIIGSEGCIAVTQPRRVGAVSVARRVAKEMGVELGSEVGYAVRFDDRSCSKTRIRFMTDGLLMRELDKDPLLSRYSAIVIDEAHERTLATDGWSFFVYSSL